MRHRTPRTGILCLLLLLGAGCGFLCAQTEPASVPLLVRYGGSVDGMSSVTVGATFALYKEQSGGPALWLETQSVSLDARGEFRTLIGSSHTDGIPLDLFTSGEARWLGVQIENQPEQPRIMLVSVPYALKAADAATLGGLPPSAFALAHSGTAATSLSTSSNVYQTEFVAAQSLAVTSANPNYVPLFSSTAGDLISSNIYQAANGAIGVNTSAPASGFHVATNLPGIATFQRIGGARFTFQNYLDNDPTGAGSIFYVTDSTAKKYQPLKFDALTLQIRPNGDPANSFYMDSTGKVGLGTTSPTDRITVNGNLALLAGGVLKFADGTTQATAATAPTVSLTSPDGSIAVGGTASAPTIAVAASGISDAKVHDVAATKITGQLADSQLASISASKITGQIADSQIASISASKVTGTLGLAQIAAGNAIPLAEEPLRMLRTRCTGTTAALSCSGGSFVAVKSSTGLYQLTMVSPFASSDTPTVTVSPIGSSAAPSNWCSVSGASYQNFSVSCFNLTGPADVDFNVIVLGAR